MGHRATLAALVLAPLVLAGGVPAVGRSVAAAGPTCDGRTPTIVGTEGSDRLTGTPGDDVIAGLGGRDLIAGGAGDDVICGDAGPDEITGGEGDDRLYGGTNGRLNVFESQAEPAGDVVVPGPGDDLVDLGVNTVAAPGRVERRRHPRPRRLGRGRHRRPGRGHRGGRGDRHAGGGPAAARSRVRRGAARVAVLRPPARHRGPPTSSSATVVGTGSTRAAATTS